MKHPPRGGFILVLVLLGLVLILPTSVRAMGEDYQQPAKPVGFDTSSKREIHQQATSLEPLTSLLVWHRGELKYELYRRGLEPGDPVNIKSASKSILSALVGIALERDDLSGLDRTLGEIFPDRLDKAPAKKRAITLRDLLLMRSGLRSTSFERYGPWTSSDDWLQYALDQPLVEEPGTETSYSTGNSHIIAAALSEVTGRDLEDYAEEHFFEPLGVRLHYWQQSPEGYRFGGNNMSLSPKGLLRIGRLYLNNGRVDGTRILTEDWVKRSTRSIVHDTYHGYPYGYYWWNADYDGTNVNFAWGHGGQYIFYVPARELVVVVTSDIQAARQADDHSQAVRDFLRNTIIPKTSPP